MIFDGALEEYNNFFFLLNIIYLFKRFLFIYLENYLLN